METLRAAFVRAGFDVETPEGLAVALSDAAENLVREDEGTTELIRRLESSISSERKKLERFSFSKKTRATVEARLQLMEEELEKLTGGVNVAR